MGRWRRQARLDCLSACSLQGLLLHLHFFCCCCRGHVREDRSATHRLPSTLPPSLPAGLPSHAARCGGAARPLLILQLHDGVCAFFWVAGSLCCVEGGHSCCQAIPMHPRHACGTSPSPSHKGMHTGMPHPPPSYPHASRLPTRRRCSKRRAPWASSCRCCRVPRGLWPAPTQASQNRPCCRQRRLWSGRAPKVGATWCVCFYSKS